MNLRESLVEVALGDATLAAVRVRVATTVVMTARAGTRPPPRDLLPVVGNRRLAETRRRRLHLRKVPEAFRQLWRRRWRWVD